MFAAAVLFSLPFVVASKIGSFCDQNTTVGDVFFNYRHYSWHIIPNRMLFCFLVYFLNNFISMSIYHCKGPNFKQFKRGFEKLRGIFCIFQYFTKLPGAMNRISNICLPFQQCESIFETCSESTHTEKYGNMFGYCKEVNLFDQWWLLLATCVGKYYTTILLVLYYTTIPLVL